jgi:N utilization substance protein B
MMVETSIPVKVTMNEYLELSKSYSTPKSSNFINGILDNLSKELVANGEIAKIGRGLIG